MSEIFSCRYCLLSNDDSETDFRSNQVTSSSQVLAEIKDKKATSTWFTRSLAINLNLR